MRACVRIRDEADARAARDELRRRGMRECAPGQRFELLVVDEWTAEGDTAVQAARREGVPVTVLAELVLERAGGPVVGVTGTAGKTSTCRALEWILRQSGGQVAISSTARSANAWPDHSLAGGSGTSVVTIAELTSTHLCHMRSVHPDVAVATTIRPDHVELHGSVEAYEAAKRRLVEELTEDDVLVLPCDDATTVGVIGERPARPCGFGALAPGEVPPGDGAFVRGAKVLLRWHGDHAECDAPSGGTALRAGLAASAAAMAVGVSAAEAAQALVAVPMVPHRMRAVTGARGITLIDDTMAATPLKGLAAVEALDHPDVVLVVGGDDAPGGVPVHASPEEAEQLSRALREGRRRAHTLLAFGPATARVREHVEVDADMRDVDAALDAAMSACPAGGTVLVSPMFPMRPEEREAVAARR
ncbi:MAG: Mur ligase family protein [Actinomycetota bacterium]|nr:Mur ligase family protein [Actinomycetota bacterium]